MPTGLEIAVAGKLLDEVFGEAFHGALARIMAKRAAMAREVILDELRKGKHWAITDDDAAAAIFTYLRAAQEGAARVNLKMMAEAFVNAAQEPTFAPDEFRRHAGSLADLSRDEVLLLAAFLNANRWLASHPQPERPPDKFPILAWTAMKGDPTLFPANYDATAVAGALGRTGWIVSAAVLGGMGFHTTTAFDTISRLVDFEVARIALE